MLKPGSQIGDGDAHIMIGEFGESTSAASKKIGCGCLVSHELLYIPCGKLDKALEEPPLFRLRPGRMPERFKDLVAFPPISEVVEINSIPI
jgi:hypothetical protein